MKRSIKAWLDRRQRAAVTQAAAAADAPPPPDVLCQLPQHLPLDAARRVLVFAPHPDDECLGCGGLLALLAQRGAQVRVVLVTDGSGAGGLPAGSDLVRQQEFRAALARLGIADHVLLNFPDGGLQPTAALRDAVLQQVRDHAPDWLVGPSSADAHRDHRHTAQAVRQAACAAPGVQAVLEYETWGPVPATHVLDIGSVFGTKMAALAEHRLALAQMDYRGASAGLSHYRGLLLGLPTAGNTAEAFVLCRREDGFDWPAGLGRPPRRGLQPGA